MINYRFCCFCFVYCYGGFPTPLKRNIQRHSPISVVQSKLVTSANTQTYYVLIIFLSFNLHVLTFKF